MEGSDNGHSKSLLNFDGESRLVGSSPTPSAWKLGAPFGATSLHEDEGVSTRTHSRIEHSKR